MIAARIPPMIPSMINDPSHRLIFMRSIALMIGSRRKANANDKAKGNRAEFKSMIIHRRKTAQLSVNNLPAMKEEFLYGKRRKKAMRNNTRGFATKSVSTRNAIHVIAESMIGIPIFHGAPKTILRSFSIIPPKKEDNAPVD